MFLLLQDGQETDICVWHKLEKRGVSTAMPQEKKGVAHF